MPGFIIGSARPHCSWSALPRLHLLALIGVREMKSQQIRKWRTDRIYRAVAAGLWVTAKQEEKTAKSDQENAGAPKQTFAPLRSNWS